MHLRPISILTYHSLDMSGSVLSVTPQDFADQMAYLADRGWRGVTLRGAVAHREATGQWPERAVVLSFDDGYANVHRWALPVLERHGFGATLFLVTAPLAAAAPAMVPPSLSHAPLLSWAEVDELAVHGWEIGAHTHTHRDLRDLPTEALEDELATSKRQIEDRLGRAVETFAYPFGNTNPASQAAAARHFRAACTTVLGRAASQPLHQLPRIDMYYVRTLRHLARLVDGRWDGYLTLRRWGRAVRPLLSQNGNGTADGVQPSTTLAPTAPPNRHVSRASAEPVSVVIAWVNPYSLLAACLEALARQEEGPAEEIIVVTRLDEAARALVRDRHPNVTLVSAPAGTPITTLRSIGLRRARGAIVAVTEDHCVPDGNWLATLRRGMQSGAAILGGPVENACTGRLRDWAAFLTEYAFAIRPPDSKPAANLSSNNVAYRRELVDGLCTTLDGGRWESFFVAEQSALRIQIDERMVMYHRRPFDFRYFVAQRYHFCRSFAGMRNRSLGRAGQVIHFLGSALLPPLLMLRIFRTLARKKRLVGRYMSCLPLIAVYLTAGAVGEMNGYLLGGGPSLENVE